MVETQELFDDIVSKLSSLRQEIASLKKTEQRRKQSEETLSYRNRLHTLLNTIRAGIIKNQTPDTLYDSVCSSFVESGLVHAAWIGTVDVAEKTVHPLTAARIDEEHFGVTVVRSPEDVVIQGTIVESIIEGETFISNRIAEDERLEAFHDTAARQKYHSLGVFPISENETIRAMLLLFSATEGFFTGEVMSSIQRVCQEISIGIQRIEREDDLQYEIDALQSVVSRYRQVTDEHFIGIAIIQKGQIKYANKSLAELFGYTIEEMLQWEPNEFTKIIHPEDVDSVTDPERRQAFEIDGITYYTYRIITKDKKVRRIHRYSKTIFFETDHAHIIAVLDDEMHAAGKNERITEEKPAPLTGDTYHILFDNNPYPAFIVDYDSFAIEKVNYAAISLYGYSEAEFRHMSVRDLHPEDELSQFLENLTQMPLTLQMEVSTKHVKRDDTVIDVDVAAKYLRMEDKTVVLMIARDVTNKRWAEDVLRESEMNYRNIFNAVGYMLFVIDRDGRILDLNTASAAGLQLQRDETIGQDFSIVNAGAKNTFDEFRDHLARAFELGEEGFDWYIKRMDGSIMLSEIVLHRGEYFGHTIVVAAIRRKDDNAGPDTVTDELSKTLESAPAALATADNEGVFNWANQAFIDLTGVALDDLVGSHITKLQTVDKDNEKIQQMNSTIQRGNVWSDEIELQKPDGAKTEIALTVTPIKTGDEPASRYVLTAKNVAREKEYMQQLLQKQKMESIDTISRAIAHDFNNILGIILGYTSFLEKRKDDPEKFRADIEEIKEAVQRGAKLIKQMLAYTHRNDVSYEPVNMNGIVQDAINLLGNTFPDAIELRSDLEDELPEILMSRHQLQQIITELCVNARDAIENDAMPSPGHGKIVIETRSPTAEEVRELFPAALEKQYVELRVTDTGIGMDEDTKNKAFDPFFSAKEFGEGKGLGLTAVYGIVKSYEGFIRIESEPQKGTTIVIYLPVKSEGEKETPADTEEIKRDESIEVPAAEPTIPVKTILIVEDEPSLLHLLKDLLESEDFRVITASDGIEAVKQYEEHKDEIAMVLSDVGLPKLDGFNAFLQMRRINPEVRAILASGYLDDKVKVDLYKEGIKDFIQKPYRAEEIISKVNELMSEPG